MKRVFVHWALAAVLAVTVLGLSACEQMGETLPVASEETAQDLSIEAPEALAGIVEDGGLTAELRHRRPATDARKMPLPILRCLELTAEQREAIAGFIHSHRDCTASIMDSLRASERPLVEAARQARRDVMEQLKAGAITREEALAQLRDIHAGLKADLEANPIRAWAQPALEACRQGLYDQIRSLLSEEQAALWDEWMTTGVVPCDPRGGVRPDSLRPDRPGRPDRPDSLHPDRPDSLHRGPRG